MRIILLGIPGRLAGPALAALISGGAELAAVVVPAPPGAPLVAAAPRPGPPRSTISLGPAAPPDLLSLAAAAGLPALAVRRMADPAVAAALAERRPDLAVAAGWPWRIPPGLLAIPRLGWLNLHPGPLPALRGPDPLFWALHAGWEQTAVTLHWMDAGLDTGDLALEAPLPMALGARYAELEASAGALGGALLLRGLSMLAAGQLPRQPQGPGAGWAPMPAAADFVIDDGWPARRAYRFLRGVAGLGQPVRVSLAGAELWLREGMALEEGASQSQPLVRAGGLLRLRLPGGVVVAR